MSALHLHRAFGRPFLPQEAAPPGSLTLRRGALLGIATAGLALAAWAGAATWCLLRSDLLSETFLARHSETERVYEERLGALKTRLDRVTSQKLVEQQGFDARLVQVSERQRELERRQAALARLVDQAGPTQAARAPTLLPKEAIEPPSPARSPAGSAGKPAPVAESFELRRESGTPARTETRAAEPPGESHDDRLSRLDRSLRTVETAQLQLLAGLRHRSEGEAARLRGVIASLGLAADRLDPAPAHGMGGPYVPVPPPSKGTAFDQAAAAADKSLSELARLRHASASLPLGRPAAGEAELTSGFGMRIDPFTRGPAMHTGLDFRADRGAEVRATAAGRVTLAEYSGGYGRMVEIDHGNGVTTRYAHLSAMRVGPGETVVAGTVLGRVGSTGRSTGPHLHYEVRVDGEPVDPQRFLRAGVRLRHPAPTALAQSSSD
jgi:murein DD-endopeptidase MepM/ murein hydrolase activator NlpD